MKTSLFKVDKPRLTPLGFQQHFTKFRVTLYYNLGINFFNCYNLAITLLKDKLSITILLELYLLPLSNTIFKFKNNTRT